jgi:hypothetical protein
MTGLLLAAMAVALEPRSPLPQPAMRSDTVLAVRHDLLGERMVPAWQLVSLHQAHQGVTVQALAGMEWVAGLDHPGDTDLYLLDLGFGYRTSEWVVGRQRSVGALRPRTLDGVTGRFIAPGLVVEGSGGIARHQDLDDLQDGVGLGRTQITGWAGPLTVRAGAEVEGGAVPVARQDLDASVQVGNGARPATLRALGVVGETPGATPTPERIHAEVGGWALERVHTAVWVGHRGAAAPESLLGDAILAAFAPEGVDEAGVRTRLSGRRWASVHGRYAVHRYRELETPVIGHAVELSHAPARSSSAVRLLPTYRFQAGVGGVFHATSAVVAADLGRGLVALGRGAVVPYRKLHQPWATAVTTGVELDQRIGAVSGVRAGVDLVADATYALDARGHVVLTVGIE